MSSYFNSEDEGGDIVFFIQFYFLLDFFRSFRKRKEQEKQRGGDP